MLGPMNFIVRVFNVLTIYGTMKIGLSTQWDEAHVDFNLAST